MHTHSTSWSTAIRPSTGFEYSCCTYSLQKQIKAYLLITVYITEFFKKLVLEGMQILFQLSLSHNIVFKKGKKKKPHKKTEIQKLTQIWLQSFLALELDQDCHLHHGHSLTAEAGFLEKLKTKIIHNK